MGKDKDKKAKASYPKQGGYPTQQYAPTQQYPQQQQYVAPVGGAPPSNNPPPYSAAPGSLPPQQMMGQPVQQQYYPPPVGAAAAAPPPMQYQQPVQVATVVMPVSEGRFDAGARFNGNAPPSVPPPPPGCLPNHAQLAAQTGGNAVVHQNRSNFLSGGSSGGYTLF